MSSKGIFTALSGAIAQNQRLDTIANNIANANTPGFKRDEQVFSEYLSAYEKTPDVIAVPRVPASIESFYDLQGGDRGYVDARGTYTDFTQGALRGTGSNLDLAIEGEGFLEVLTPQGVRLTRHGSLTLDAEGRLVTKNGHPILLEGAPGSDPNTRTVKLNSANVVISPSGEILDNGVSSGRISLQRVENKDAIRKQGNSLYAFNDGVDPQMTDAYDAKIHQGFLESSNINVIKEMTDMIAATRSFESSQKAMKAFDEMDGKLVNEVPKVG